MTSHFYASSLRILSGELINLTMVLIFCVEFRELSHLTRDLPQAERKINAVTRWANAQNDIYFTQNGQSCHLSENSQSVVQLVTTVISFSAWDKSRVKWDNSWNLTHKMRTSVSKNLWSMPRQRHLHGQIKRLHSSTILSGLLLW